MAKSPKTCTSHSPPRARTLSGPATRRRSTRELLQSRNRAFGPNGVPTTSRQTSATRTDTTSRLPISLGSTNKRYEPSTHLRPAAGCHAFAGPAKKLPTAHDTAKACGLPAASPAPYDHENRLSIVNHPGTAADPCQWALASRLRSSVHSTKSNRLPWPLARDGSDGCECS